MNCMQWLRNSSLEIGMSRWLLNWNNYELKFVFFTLFFRLGIFDEEKFWKEKKILKRRTIEKEGKKELLVLFQVFSRLVHTIGPLFRVFSFGKGAPFESRKLMCLSRLSSLTSIVTPISFKFKILVLACKLSKAAAKKRTAAAAILHSFSYFHTQQKRIPEQWNKNAHRLILFFFSLFLFLLFSLPFMWTEYSICNNKVGCVAKQTRFVRWHIHVNTNTYTHTLRQTHRQHHHHHLYTRTTRIERQISFCFTKLLLKYLLRFGVF